jgi:hypothetical protein
VTGGWKVSDFVTLGSPLGNATFLVTDGKDEFARLKEERLMPTAPPQPFEKTQHPTSFIDQKAKAVHHAAVFSVVRWTNIYDEVDPGTVHKGDFISAPVTPADHFGEAIKDVKVTMLKADGKRGFTHNDYWVDLAPPAKRPAEQVVALREAVGFTRM